MFRTLPRSAMAILLGLPLAGAIAVVGGVHPEAHSQPSSNEAPTELRSIREFGAKGDGVADDTGAFHRAIAHGGAFLPPGTFRISQTLDIDLSKSGSLDIRGMSGARVVMTGAGPAFRIRGTHGGTADPATVAAGVWRQERFPRLSGFEITASHPEADGIEALGTMQLTLTHLLIRQVRHAIRLRERNRNVLIADSHLYDNRGIGIWLDEVNLHQTNIGNCHVSYNRAGGIVVRGGDVRNVHVTGCDIEGNMSPEMPPTANILLDCAHGSVAEIAITGCTIQHDGKSPESANIRILGRGLVPRRGEVIEFQCGHVTIANNVLSDVHYNIDLRGVRGATVTGNTLWQGYTANLRLDDCQQIVLSANVLERNPLYGYTTEACNRVVISNCRDLTIQGLHLQQIAQAEAAMVLENCERLNVQGCTILDCDHVGLLVKNTKHSTIHGCVIRDDRLDAPHRSQPLVLQGDTTGTQSVGNILVGVTR